MGQGLRQVQTQLTSVSSSSKRWDDKNIFSMALGLQRDRDTYYIFVVLGICSRVLYMVSEHSTPELYLRPKTKDTLKGLAMTS